MGTIIQAYSSIIAIIGVYMVFLTQKEHDRTRDLSTRLKTKADSLISFINREISPAYTNEPVIRVDSEDCDETLKAIDQYRLERQKEVPNLDMKDVKRLLMLWTIMQREREELVQLRNELLVRSKKSVMPHQPSLFFIGYFASVLFFAFLGIFLIFIGHNFQYLVTQVAIVLAVIGLLPLVNLLYNIR